MATAADLLLADGMSLAAELLRTAPPRVEQSGVALSAQVEGSRLHCMDYDAPKRPADTKSRAKGANGGGGAAASGGFSYQAAVTAVAMSHALAGAPLGWLDGLVFDAPIALAAETGSGGDDLRLTFADGVTADAQIKKGLRAGKDLQDALWALATTVSDGSVTFGLLVVDPNSSGTIRGTLADDIRRLGENPNAEVSKAAEALRSRMKAAGLEVQQICGSLRVVTLPALEGADASVRTAHAHLARVCRGPEDASSAWDRLYRDAHFMMARSGLRTRAAIAAVLRSADIRLSADPSDGPTALLTKLCDWTMATTAEFTILGVPKPLPIDSAWLRMTARVRDGDLETSQPDLMSALAEYHDPKERGGHRDASCDATALARFIHLSVVMAGPGSGKTTLLKVLARTYARDGFPVLRVSARNVARRMAKTGEAFTTAAFALGLADSGVSPEAAQAASFGNWVLLCDGLDECGSQQDLVADGLLQAAAADPGLRIVATTRTIGYRPAKLAAWRHYDLPFGDRHDAIRQTIDLLNYILPASAREHLDRRVKDALEDTDAGKIAARSPLLLGLCAALFARGSPLGKTRVQFYRAVFDMLEAEPPPRALSAPTSVAVRNRLLDLLGWTVIRDPQISAADAIQACAKILKVELEIPLLKAQDLAEECLAYWQALGVVEKLHFGDGALLAFSHKTFGEFAAGRHLAGLPLAEQEPVVEAATDTSVLSEVISFASALGAAPVFIDDLIRRGFSGPKGQERLLLALEVLGEARPPLDVDRIEKLVDAALERIEGTHRQWAFDTAEAFADVAHCALPQLLPRLSGLCGHKQLWTSLAAWSLRTILDGDALELGEAVEALHRFPELRSGDAMSDLGGRFVFGRNTGRGLLQRMAPHVIERVLKERPLAEAVVELERIGPLLEAGTMDFYLSVAALVQRFGAVLPDPSWKQRFPNILDMFKETAEQRGAFDAILGVIGGDAEAIADERPDRSLYTLAAFFELIGLPNQALPEIWVWRHPFDETAVAAVFRVFATIGGLRLDALARDAASLRAEIAAANAADMDALSVLFKRTPSVDILHPDFEKPMDADIGVEILQRALRHPSNLVVVPTLKLAVATGKKEDWRRMATVLLADGTRETLWAAANLASQLPRDEAVALLLAHAASPARPGSAYVFGALKALEVTDHPARIPALTATFFGPRVDAAVAAAAWVRAAPSSNPEETDILQRAFDHWLVAEEPYPKQGGSVPPSPRDDLAAALYAAGATHFDTLLDWARDDRTDVVNVAKACLGDLVSRDAAARNQFIEGALRGDIAPPTLGEILETPDTFSSAEANSLLPLLDRPDGRLRFTAMSILDWPVIISETRAEWLGRLSDDPVAEIREKAIKMIG